MLATTRYTYSEQYLNCSLLDDPSCAYNTSNTSTYCILSPLSRSFMLVLFNMLAVVADIEQFTLLIDHTVYAPNVGMLQLSPSLLKLNHYKRNPEKCTYAVGEYKLP